MSRLFQHYQTIYLSVFHTVFYRLHYPILFNNYPEMKYTTILAAIVLSAIAVSAAPCHDSSHKHHNVDVSHENNSNHEVNINHENNSNHEVNINHENNSNRENNSNHEDKKVGQGIGSVGSSSQSSSGLLSGLLGGNILGGGILSETTNNNYVGQHGENN